MTTAKKNLEIFVRKAFFVVLFAMAVFVLVAAARGELLPHDRRCRQQSADCAAGALGRHLAPPLLWQLPMRVGVSTADLRPIDWVAHLHAAVLIASGADDQHTPWVETERLFNAASEPKQLWRVDGAAHVDLHAFAPQAYEEIVLRFLAQHLRRQP